MTNWKRYKLGEITNYINRGVTPSYSEDGVIVINQKCIRDGKVSYEQSRFTNPEKKKITKEKYLHSFDILINSTGQGTLGRVGQVKEITQPTTVDSHVTIVRAIPSVNAQYLGFVLKSKQALIENLAEGTTGQTELSRYKVADIELQLPDLPTQTAIAEILSSLDDKIELNNKINAELEALAQTLFKQWFIDFEFPNSEGQPYRSSGGKMVDSELGEIPEGWEVYAMSDLLETVSKTYPLKSVNEVVFLNTGDIQDGKFLHRNFSDPKTLPGQAKKSIAKKDILYSEIRPVNRRFAYVYFNANEYVVSTKLMVLRSIVEINSLFHYFILTQQEQIDYLQHLAESRSGTFPQITFSELSTVKVALPEFNVVNEFVSNVLEPLYESKFLAEEENKQLSSLRDSLLLKLISGEIEVAEANSLNRDSLDLLDEKDY